MNDRDILLLHATTWTSGTFAGGGLRTLVWANCSDDQSSYDEDDYSAAPEVAF